MTVFVCDLVELCLESSSLKVSVIFVNYKGTLWGYLDARFPIVTSPWLDNSVHHNLAHSLGYLVFPIPWFLILCSCSCAPSRGRPWMKGLLENQPLPGCIKSL